MCAIALDTASIEDRPTVLGLLSRSTFDDYVLNLGEKTNGLLLGCNMCPTVRSFADGRPLVGINLSPGSPTCTIEHCSDPPAPCDNYNANNSP